MFSRRFICLILALLTLATFAQVRHFEFTNYDDAVYVSENSHVQAGLSAEGLRWAFVDCRTVFWIPMTWLSHELDCQVFGLDAGAHHIVNLLLHVANVLLLFLVLVRMTKASWPSAFVAACFAVHPLNVEPIAWIAERKGVLSTFFLLLTLHAWVRWVNKPHAGRYALALGLFALGLLAKPMLVTLPLLLLVLDGWPLQRFQSRTWRSLLVEKIPFFVLSLAVGLVTVLLASRAEVWISTEQVPLGQRLLNALGFVGVYLWKLIAPLNLAVFYPYMRNPPIPNVVVALLVIFISVLAWRRRAREPWLLAGWAWYLIALLPVLRVLQVGAHAVADRYAYVPLIGLFVVIAWSASAAADRWQLPVRAIGIVAGAVLMGLAALSWIQTEVWRNSISLFSHALEVTPKNVVAQINLGAGLEQAGRADEARLHYEEAILIEPTRAQAHHNLANILDLQGHFSEALPHFQEAIRLRPREALPRCSLGQALVGQGRIADALAQYAVAMNLAPADPQPHYLTGVAQLKQGQFAAAAGDFHDALRLNPNHVKALDRLARLRAAAPDEAVRIAAEAIDLANRAVLLTGGKQPAVLDTLAMAFAEGGRFEEAVSTIQNAMRLLEQGGAVEESKLLEPHLAKFKSRQPWRENVSAPP
jgi:tetratricopeptide (TPR) repeat protein